MNNLSSLQEKVREEFKKKFINLCTIVLPKEGKHKDVERTLEVEDFLISSLEQAYKAGAESAVDYIESMMEDEEIKNLHLGLTLEKARQQ